MASIACMGLQVASGQCLERCSTRAIFRPREARVGTGVFTTNAKRRARLVLRRTGVVVRASMGDPGSPSIMSAESAMKLLGVRENSSFDDIVRAKNRLSTSNTSEEEVKQVRGEICVSQTISDKIELSPTRTLTYRCGYFFSSSTPS